MHAAKGPVEREHAAAIVVRELAMVVAGDTGGRSAIHVREDVGRVGEVIVAGPTAEVALKPPAVMSAGRDVEDSRGRVPG